jgi:molecular chaperone HscC
MSEPANTETPGGGADPSSDVIVGIDLGTTNSLVAVMDGDGPRTLANELGEHLTPSAVAYADDGTLLVGRAAKDRLAVEPASGRAFFKRDMGSTKTYRMGGRDWTPTACSAAVLRELKRVAEVSLGHPVTRAVVTVPAYFHEPQRQATLEAAQLAGLKVERILNEPTAAALAFGQRVSGLDQRLIVLDLGGGTFDVTLLEAFEGVIEVRASGGDSRLGGEDYTDKLLELAVDRTGRKPSATEAARWRQRIEVAKRQLTDEEHVEVPLGSQAVQLTRADMERVTADITARILPLILRCLRDAGLSKEDVDDVLLVGGASRMPAVVQLAIDFFGRLPNRSLDPDRVIALGAAVQAARAARSEAVKDLVMTDVCPHSLGVEISRETSGALLDGIFLPILDRNVTVPISRVERLNTIYPTQDEITLNVYQGESRRVEENTLLGKMRVTGLRAKPGQKHPGEVDVRFTYDASGLLEVEVTTIESGRVQSQVIEGRPGALTQAQIAETLKRLAPLKVRLRDLLPNRARLERAHRLYVELTGIARTRLSGLIGDFEAALETEDLQAAKWAGAMLDQEIGSAFSDEGERDREGGRGERGADPDSTPPP